MFLNDRRTDSGIQVRIGGWVVRRIASMTLSCRHDASLEDLVGLERALVQLVAAAVRGLAAEDRFDSNFYHQPGES
jgi:hypothetical protein